MPRGNGSNGAPPVTTDPSIPVPIQRALRRVEGYVSQLRGVDQGQQAQIEGKLGASKADMLSLAGYMRNALQATGTHPMSIASLPGVASEPQKTNVTTGPPGPPGPIGPAGPPGAVTVTPIRTTAVSTTLTATDYTVVATVPSITITLFPSPSLGQTCNVKNGNSVAGQLITVAASVNIDAATTVTLGATASLQVQYDGTQWRVL